LFFQITYCDETTYCVDGDTQPLKSTQKQAEKHVTKTKLFF